MKLRSGIEAARSPMRLAAAARDQLGHPAARSRSEPREFHE
jgi:hypothetical protein